MTEYTILGAGVSGLSIGIKLIEQGHSVSILEKAAIVGGLASTTVREGYRLDIGPHFITSHNSQVLQEILDLFSEEELVSFSRSAKILFDNRFLEYPLTAKSVFTQMGLKHAFLASLSYLWVTLRNINPSSKDNADSFEAWARNNFGDYLFKIFFKPYTEQFWGLPCDRLSLDCVPLVTKMSFLKTLKMLFLSKFQRNSLSIAERETTLPLHYPRKGFGEVANKLSEKFLLLGGTLKTQCSVSRVEREENHFSVEFLHEHARYSIESPKLISTIPIPLLLKLLDPPPPEEVVVSTKNVSYLSVIVVYLVVGDFDVFDCAYLYLLGRPYNRISNIRKFCASLCPEDQNMIACEITCRSGDSTWSLSDEELTTVVIDGMTKDGFLGEEDVLKSFVLRREHAYPFYTIDYKKSLDDVNSYIDSIPGLTSIGRTGGFKYMDIDQCIEDASTYVSSVLT